MHQRGSGRRRALAVAAVALALMVAAPELASTAGAASGRRRGVHTEFATKHKKKKLTPAQKKAKFRAYLKAHPKLVARKLKSYPAVVRKKLKTGGVKGKATTVKHKKKKKKKAKPVFAVKASKKKSKKPLTAAQKKKRRRTLAAAAAAKKSKTKTHPLSAKDYFEILLLALLPFGVIAALLLGTDRMRRPRAPSPSRRRRTLVITPMRGNR